jgi:hypothetical protein
VISPQAVRLDNIPGDTHDVFSVDLIRLAGTDAFESQIRSDPQPGPTLVDGEPEYEIERILQQRTRRGRGRGRNQIKEYLVKWTGYLKPEWTPAENLEDTMALDEWETRQRLEKPTASTAKIFTPRNNGRSEGLV